MARDETLAEQNVRGAVYVAWLHGIRDVRVPDLGPSGGLHSGGGIGCGGAGVGANEG